MAKLQSRRDSFVYFLFTVPGVIFFVVLFVVPVVMGFFYSFTNWNGISPNFDFVGLKNFRTMFVDTRVSYSMKFSLIFTLAFVVLTNVTALALAFLLNSNIRARSLFRGLYFFPAVVALVVVGLIYDQIFYHVLPRIGQALEIDMLSRSIMGNSELAPIGILFVKMWREIPIPTVLFIAGLQNVPQDLVDASVIDGADWWQRFAAVVFPFLVPVLSMNLVLTVRNGVMVFDVIKVMTNGGPGYSTSSLGITIYNMGFYEMKFGFGTAVSLVLFLIIAVVSFGQISILRTKGTGQL